MDFRIPGLLAVLAGFGNAFFTGFFEAVPSPVAKSWKRGFSAG
jgi:hypothetical protein